METEERARLERMLLESLVAADKADCALRCYFLTHRGFAGVSDLSEYEALQIQQAQAADERHRAYMALIGYLRQ